MSLHHLEAELVAVDTFLESHRVIGAGGSSETVETSMVASVVLKIKSAPLEATALAQLNTKVAAMKFITAESKGKLGTALGEAAIAALSTYTRSSYRCAQACDHPENYPEQEVWDVVTSPEKSLRAKTQAFVECFVEKGLVHPNKKAVKAIAALLAASHWSDGSPDGAARHELVLSVKTLFKGQRAGRQPSIYVTNCPTHPTYLSHYVQLYRIGKAPKSFLPNGFMREHTQMVLRSTNKQIRRGNLQAKAR